MTACFGQLPPTELVSSHSGGGGGGVERPTLMRENYGNWSDPGQRERMIHLYRTVNDAFHRNAIFFIILSTECNVSNIRETLLPNYY